MIGILHYGMGNISSVKNAFNFIGQPVTIISSPKELEGITHLVIPGVGAFSEGMANLKQAGLIDVIQKRAAAGTPILGICLGMQLLASLGEEGVLTEGLNIIPGRVARFPFNEPRVPHVGWDNIIIKKDNPILMDAQDFYFVHSYHFIVDDPNTEIASCDYGIEFTAAVQKGKVFGVQFHPEKSFQAGLDVLRKFAVL